MIDKLYIQDEKEFLKKYGQLINDIETYKFPYVEIVSDEMWDVQDYIDEAKEHYKENYYDLIEIDIDEIIDCVYNCIMYKQILVNPWDEHKNYKYYNFVDLFLKEYKYRESILEYIIENGMKTIGISCSELYYMLIYKTIKYYIIEDYNRSIINEEI